MRNVLKDYKNRRVALRHESDRPECPTPCLIELQTTQLAGGTLEHVMEQGSPS